MSGIAFAAVAAVLAASAAAAAAASAFGSKSVTTELVTNFPSRVGISRSRPVSSASRSFPAPGIHSASSLPSKSPPSHSLTSATPTPTPIIPLFSPCCSSAAVNSASPKKDGSTGSDISPCHPPVFPSDVSSSQSPPSTWPGTGLSPCSRVCAICCAIAYIACALARSLPPAACKGGEREAVRTKLRMCAGSAAQYAPSGLSPPPPASIR